PDCVGVPDSTPAAVSEMPAGSVPATVQRYGAAIDANPPMAASAVEYGWLTMPPGSVVVATSSGSKTRVVRGWGCVLIPFASVPTTTNVKMPEELIDVAVKVPVVGNWATGEISVTPGGSDPDTTEKVKGSLPPTASMLARYGRDRTPSGSVVVMMSGIEASIFGVVLPASASAVSTECDVVAVPMWSRSASAPEKNVPEDVPVPDVVPVSPTGLNTRSVTLASSPGASATVAF